MRHHGSQMDTVPVHFISAGKSLTLIIYSTCFHAPTPYSQFLAPPLGLTSCWNIAYEIWQMSMPRTSDPNVTFRKPDTEYISITLSWTGTNRKYFVEPNNSSTSVGDTKGVFGSGPCRATPTLKRVVATPTLRRRNPPPHSVAAFESGGFGGCLHLSRNQSWGLTFWAMQRFGVRRATTVARRAAAINQTPSNSFAQIATYTSVIKNKNPLFTS